MIYFDVTKAGRSRHLSGLQRVSTRLRTELGARVRSAIWKNKAWHDAATGNVVALGADDWVITPELFAEAERPGWWELLAQPITQRGRMAAIFHDAIPLKFPQWTWPQSVARHPEYLKMLACFDRVLAVSDASRGELTGFWEWQGVTPVNPVGRIELGADFLPQMGTDNSIGAAAAARADGVPSLLCVGIIEPRKNQMVLLDVAERLIERGIRFRLDLVGRINPHFGDPIARRMRTLAAKYPEIRYHGAAPDEAVAKLWQTARASVFPTLAEGCGLPLLESLARGVPCVASDLPVLRESDGGGGCVFVDPHDRGAWAATLTRVLTDTSVVDGLRAQARARVLPTWHQAAEQLLQSLS